MKLINIFLLFIVSIFLFACSSPERQALRAQEEAHETQAEVGKERLKLIEEYKECIADAGEDSSKANACESYLKAAEALH